MLCKKRSKPAENGRSLTSPERPRVRFSEKLLIGRIIYVHYYKKSMGAYSPHTPCGIAFAVIGKDRLQQATILDITDPCHRLRLLPVIRSECPRYHPNHS